MQRNLEFFRNEYKKQQKLQEIVSSRILRRPNIKKWQVATCFAILPFLLFFLIFYIFITKSPLLLKLVYIAVGIMFLTETYLRFCFILTIKCYQRYAKEETRRKCKCIPSCSEYALLCLKTFFPLLLAILKIKKRLFVTCKGEEYVVDFPTKKMRDNFENSIQ